MSKKQDNHKIINEWVERNLTQETADGSLSKAFEVDGIRLLPDLAMAWSKQPAEVDVSRIYGKDGVIHDPRTGVTSNRIKEVWKGRLDEFLEGWRRTRG